MKIFLNLIPNPVKPVKDKNNQLLSQQMVSHNYCRYSLFISYHIALQGCSPMQKLHKQFVHCLVQSPKYSLVLFIVVKEH